MRKLLRIFLSGSFPKMSTIFIILLNLASGFLVISANRHLAVLFNDYFMINNLFGVALPLLITLGLFISVFLLGILGTYIHQSLQWGGEARLKSYLVNKLLRTETKYFYDKQPADIWSNINNVTQQVSYFIGILISIFSSIITLVFHGVVIFNVDIYAGLLSLLMLPLFIILSQFIGKSLMPLQHEIMSQHRELSVVSQEAIKGVSNVKAKNAYDFFIARIMKAQAIITKNMVKINTTGRYKQSIVSLIGILSPIVILFGAMQISDNLLADTSNVLILYINIPIFMGYASVVFSSITEYKRNLPAITELKNLADLPQENSGSIEIDYFDSLSTKNVQVSFGNSKIVKIPDITISKGEKVMFFGESGVGKSSLFNILMGFNQDYSGEIMINGIELRQIDLKSIRKCFGISFQNLDVLTLTLADNILLGLSKEDKVLEDVIETTNLNLLLNDKNDEILRDQTLSGGERSRIGLAGSLIRNTDVLLIDETFSSVDEEMEAYILKKMNEKYSDKTIICISHRMTSAKYFDRTIDFNIEID